MLDGIMGTLDQQVDDKKSMMRANPGMQGTVGKDLIGVMALQKLQKEKQAAENELMLAQQNNPATIKEQLEREVAGLTQNEMATQTAGILNQRQMQQQGKQQQRPQQQQQRPQQQQQRPQGIQQAARPPMGGAPRPMPQGAGIAGAPRPPMMASGGIVGYNKGGTTISDERLKALGMTRAQFEALAPAAQAALAPKQPPKLGKTREERGAAREAAATERTAQRAQQSADFNQKMQDARQRQARATAEAAGLQIADPVGTISPEEDAEINAASAAIDKKDPNTYTVDQARQYVSDQYTKMDASDANATDTDTDPNAVTNTKAAPEAGPLAAMLKEKMNTGPTEEQKANIKQNQATSRLDTGVKTTLDSMSKGDDPLAAMEAAQKKGDTRYNQEYDAAGIKAKRQAQDDEMARQLTPEALKEQRLRAGAVQRGGLAGARAISGNRADARRMQMYKNSADNYAADMKANVEKLKAVDSTAARIMEQIAADRRVAIDVFGKLSIADQQAVTADKDRFQAENQAAMDALLKGMKIESEAALMRSIQDSKDSAELRGTWEAIRTNRADQLTAYQKSQEYLMLDEGKRPAALEVKRQSLIRDFESLETEIIRQLQALNPTLDYSAFLKDSGGGDDPEFKPKNKQEVDDLQIR